MLTSWLTGYLVPWLATFVLLGIVLQVADRYFGVPLYRWYFNRASAEGKMPQTMEMGFFHNQPLPRQHKRALIISTVQSLVTVFVAKFGFGELVTEIFVLVLEAWFLLPGLWLGNKLYHLLRRQDEIFETIENRQEVASGLVERAKKAVFGTWDALRTRVATPPPTPAPHAPPQETASTPPKEDSRAALKARMDNFGAR
jgi:hypothetical protein